MDEMLSIALWIMIIFMTIGATVTWFGTQSNMPTGLGLVGYTNSMPSPDTNKYQTQDCGSFSIATAISYPICFIGKVTTPVFDLIGWVWNLLTGWIALIHAIFIGVPAGGLFEGLLTPFLIIVEIGAVLVILMRVASIVAGAIP